MANNLINTKTLSAAVPASPSRLLTAGPNSFILVQSAVVSSHEATAPATIRAWVATADATVGSMPSTMHAAYGEVAPKRDVEILNSSLILEPGESLAVEQQGDSFDITLKVLFSTYSSPVLGE